MARRLLLHSILKTILGRNNVYFQPPTNIKLSYPCIIYRLDDVFTDFADNNPYIQRKRYIVTVIDKDPDSLIPDKVGSLPTSVFDRFYTAENLNHSVYKLYF